MPKRHVPETEPEEDFPERPDPVIKKQIADSKRNERDAPSLYEELQRRVKEVEDYKQMDHLRLSDLEEITKAISSAYEEIKKLVQPKEYEKLKAKMAELETAVKSRRYDFLNEKLDELKEVSGQIQKKLEELQAYATKYHQRLQALEAKPKSELAERVKVLEEENRVLAKKQEVPPRNVVEEIVSVIGARNGNDAYSRLIQELGREPEKNEEISKRVYSAALGLDKKDTKEAVRRAEIDDVWVLRAGYKTAPFDKRWFNRLANAAEEIKTER